MSDSVLVVGGGSGIGAALTDRLVDRTTPVTVIDRLIPPSIGANPGSVVRELDIRDWDLVKQTIAELPDAITFGGVFVAAGVVNTAPITEADERSVRMCVDVNITGAIACIHACLDRLQRGASIVLCSSVAAARGGGLLGGSTYAASKAALEGLTRGLARELGPRGVRVNCVAPGPTRTPMLGDLTPQQLQALAGASLLGRLAEPDEIAAGVEFLLSPLSSYITGQVLHIDGGASLG